MKFHSTQLTRQQKQLIRDSINIIDNWEFSDHAKMRITTKEVSVRELSDAIAKGDIIECHNNAREVRVLLRYEIPNKDYSVCAVVSIRGSVVTTYKNMNDDKHATLDWSQYA